MNYELALKLKNAGFQQDNWDALECQHVLKNQEEKNAHMFAQDCEMVVIPTLSELIEACGDRFTELHRYHDILFWSATSIQDYSYITKRGDTPEEAVANLWLALNIK